MMKNFIPTLLILSLCSFSFAQQSQVQVPKKMEQELTKLANHPKIKKAFQTIEDLESLTISRHIELTEIPAPPFKETLRGLAVKKYFEDLGLADVHVDNEGNVLGWIYGTQGNQTVAVDAHLDTVFPEGTDVQVRIVNDTLKAPGIADDTRGLSMLLTIIQTINSQQIKPKDNLLFVASVGEEGPGDLRGMKYLFRDGGPKIDRFISIDGGTIGRINNQALGSYRYRVTFNGPGGHSWGAFGLANPHHALGAAIHKFVEKADAYTDQGPKTSYNIAIVSGGTSVNSIPFISQMDIDVRSIDPSRLDVMETFLKEAVDEALNDQNQRKRRGESLTAEIEKIGNRPSGATDIASDLVQRAWGATLLFGAKPELTIGSTNANIPIAKGIPAITVGIGGKASNAHSLDEWWINENGHQMIQLVLLIALSQAGGI